MSRRRHPWLLAGAVVALLAVAVVANASDSGQSANRPRTESSAPASTTASQKPVPEEGTEGLPQPHGAGTSPAPPVAAARAFAEAWINRATAEGDVAHERTALLALSGGELATRINFAFIQQARRSGDGGSRGSVIWTRVVGRPLGGQLVEVLVTTREQLTEQSEPSEPPHYSLYLARLERQGRRGYLLSDWQPH